jgi:hypothetical protein
MPQFNPNIILDIWTEGALRRQLRRSLQAKKGSDDYNDTFRQMSLLSNSQQVNMSKTALVKLLRIWNR